MFRPILVVSCVAYLACGFDNGFAVYQCNPFQRLFSRRESRVDW